MPFDEAGVLRVCRQRAHEAGAVFLSVDAPVEVTRAGDQLELRAQDLLITTSLLVVAAGAGSLPILDRLGLGLPAVLRQTPLLVHPDAHNMRVPILVDPKFSSVLHNGGERRTLAIGSSAYQEPVPFVIPEDRRIEEGPLDKFRAVLPPRFQEYFDKGRFTAGVEVIPKRPRSHLEAWVEDFDNVVFASPGRATLAWFTALEVLKRIRQRRSLARCRWSGAPAAWVEDIHMHFSDQYSYCDRLQERRA